MSRRLLTDPQHLSYRRPEGERPAATPVRQLDDRRPYFAGRHSPGSPIHILGRDGYSVVATVHRPGADALASHMAAAEELFEAGERVMTASSAELPDALRALGDALLKAKTPPREL